MPELVACWEKEFDESPDQPRYVVTLDFVLKAGSSKIRKARVRSIAATDADGRALPPTGREDALSECIEDALDRSALPVKADDNGPGFSTSNDLEVENFRIELVDASAKKRRMAEARQSHVLIGPRADRCQGLYSHDPPRDSSTLYEEIGRTEARALSEEEPDQRARGLQKTYDVKLELIERLEADMNAPELPDANRARVREALSAAAKSARTTGELIGCDPPLPEGLAREKKRR